MRSKDQQIESEKDAKLLNMSPQIQTIQSINLNNSEHKRGEKHETTLSSSATRADQKLGKLPNSTINQH